jgi:hypothetical protein
MGEFCGHGQKKSSYTYCNETTKPNFKICIKINSVDNATNMGGREGASNVANSWVL